MTTSKTEDETLVQDQDVYSDPVVAQQDYADDISDSDNATQKEESFISKALSYDNPFRGLIISISVILVLVLITTLYFVFKTDAPLVSQDGGGVSAKKETIALPSNIPLSDITIDTKNERYLSALRESELNDAEEAANAGQTFIPLPRSAPVLQKTQAEKDAEARRLSLALAKKNALAAKKAKKKLNDASGGSLKTPSLNSRSLPDSPIDRVSGSSRASSHSSKEGEAAKEAKQKQVEVLTALAIAMLEDNYALAGGGGMEVTSEKKKEDSNDQEGGAQVPSTSDPVIAQSSKDELIDEDYEVMSPGDLVFGSLTTAINSDIPTAIRATIDTGIFAGGVAIGSFERNAEWMAVKFNSVSLNGKTYPIEWYAINLTAERAEDFVVALEGDVDNHFWSKYFFTLAGSWLAGYGEAFANSGVTQQNADGSSLLIRNPAAVAKDAALANVGKSIVGLFAEAATRPITVSIPAGTPLGLMATKPIFASEYDISSLYKNDFNPNDVEVR